MEKQPKWISVKILRSLKHEINKFCNDEKNGFVNSNQYIHHVLRNALNLQKETAE